MITKDLRPHLGPAIGDPAMVPLIEGWASEAAATSRLATEARRCAELLAGSVPGVEMPPTLRHGRFSPYHVYDLGDGPAVLDWDTFGQGPLELDAANYLTRLERVGGAPDAASVAAGHFRAAVAPLVSAGVLAWHEAALRVRGAALVARRQPTGWEERAAELLAAARRVLAG